MTSCPVPVGPAAHSGRRNGKRAARAAAVIVILTALAAAGVTEWPALPVSFAMLGHLHWIWIPILIALESASMAAFAIMLRRLLAAGGAQIGVRPMLATTFAANALSVSVPLAGPGLGTAFAFRRYVRQGADAPLAGWSLLAGGVVSSAAAALIVVGGGLASGRVLVTTAAVSSGVLAVAALLAVVAAVRRPRLRGALGRPAAWTLGRGSRLFRRFVRDPRETIRVWAERLSTLRLSPAGWITVTGLALANWLTDAVVLAVSIHAIGGVVPWRLLLLVYGAGVAGQSLNLTPGGLGITEGAFGLTLIASGLRASQALAAVLLYRLVSFWLVAVAVWLVFLWLRLRHGVTAAVRAPVQRHQRPFPGLNRAVPAQTATIGDVATRLPAHEVVLLHGQPGSSADWQQVTAQLPATLHALAVDRPGYGSSPLPAGGFGAGARAVLDELDARGIQRAVLVGHSYGGGVALSAASLAPDRVEAVVLLAGVGPGCVNGWDRLLGAPGIGPLCALIAWRLTPWIARARLASIARRRGRPPGPGEHVNWQVWAQASRDHGRLWRTFLAEQRALLHELDGVVCAARSVQAPVLLLADPLDAVVPVDTARRLAQVLPHARLHMVAGAGHHLPRRAAGAVASAIASFVAATETAALPEEDVERRPRQRGDVDSRGGRSSPE